MSSFSDHNFEPPSWLSGPSGPGKDQILRRRVAALLTLIGLIVIIVIAVSSCGSSDRPKPKPVATHPKPAKPTPAEIAARENNAIDDVLAYTPFVARGSSKKREVALTFDDGPGPYTPKILKILEAHNVPATFFIVGQQLNDFGETLTKEVQAGFTVANHTENHPQLPTLSKRDQKQQLIDDTDRMMHWGAPKPRLFRPPYRLFDSTTLKLIKKIKMLMVLWSVDTEDYRQPGVQYIVNQAVKNARPGAIILMHDGGGDRTQTVAALPHIIGRLRAKGYKIVSVPQMLLNDPPPKDQKLPPLGKS